MLMQSSVLIQYATMILALVFLVLVLFTDSKSPKALIMRMTVAGVLVVLAAMVGNWWLSLLWVVNFVLSARWLWVSLSSPIASSEEDDQEDSGDTPVDTVKFCTYCSSVLGCGDNCPNCGAPYWRRR